jgi:pimeloyl-ACP methyl ester carboxylesterase
VGVAGTLGKFRSALVRPLDRRYPTNFAVMILAPLGGVITGVIGFGQTGPSLQSAEGAIRGALTVFGGWALAREIAPDDNPAAFVSMALAFVTLLFFPDVSVLPLFTAIMLARILNRSVGVPPTVVDSAAVTLLAAWAAYGTRHPGPLFISAAAFGLDAKLSPSLPRQWWFVALSLGAGLALLLWGKAGPPSARGGDVALALPVLAIAIAYTLVIFFTRNVRSVADRTGKPLSVHRVRAAMTVTCLMGIQGALSGAIAPTPSTLIWAVLAGLLLMTIVRPQTLGFFPLFFLALTACAGSASQSPSPVINPVDTMVDVGDHRLHFKVWPNRSDLTLVFEHGGGASLASWENIPHTAARDLSLRVVAYDRAGLGESEVGALDLVPEDEIRELRRALDGLEAGRIVLIGHSFGAMLAVLHAQLDRRVVGLVLVDPMNADFIRRVTLSWLNTTVPDIVTPSSARDTVIIRMKRSIEGLAATTEPALASLDIPIVVISAGISWWGEADKETAWRASHETIAGMKPNRRLLIATRSRHDIPETEPDRIIDALRLLLTLLPEPD